jgi:hypothetical protein
MELAWALAHIERLLGASEVPFGTWLDVGDVDLAVIQIAEFRTTSTRFQFLLSSESGAIAA